MEPLHVPFQRRGELQPQDTEKCWHAHNACAGHTCFGYGQVESYGTSGDFYEALNSRFTGLDSVALSRIPDRDAIVDSIKTLLGRGR